MNMKDAAVEEAVEEVSVRPQVYFAGRHVTEEFDASVLMALSLLSSNANNANIDVEAGAGSFADGAAAAEPCEKEHNGSLSALAHFAAEEYRLMESERESSAQGGVAKKRRETKQADVPAVVVVAKKGRKNKPADVPAVVVAKKGRQNKPADVPAVAEEDIAPGEKATVSKGISTEDIGLLYHELTTSPYKHRHVFGEIMKVYAKKCQVSISSLRNIMAFKTRREDSHEFWNDELWKLYNDSVRCETCLKENSEGSRVLCSHFPRGRPAAVATHTEIAAPRFRQSSAAHGTTKKANSGLKRAYVVQINLARVWECLGCPDSTVYLLGKAAN